MAFYQVEEDYAESTSDKYRVEYQPTFVAFKHGKEIGRYISIKNDELKRFFIKVQNVEVAMKVGEKVGGEKRGIQKNN